MATAKNNHEKKVQDFYDEKVTVYIPRPEAETEDSVTITLNGTNYQIQYDTEVSVPRKVALIVEESKKNKKIAEDYMRQRAGNHLLGEM
jgi:hypothetical protein